MGRGGDDTLFAMDEKGEITVPPGPGLGLELLPDLDRRFTATVRVSRPD